MTFLPECGAGKDFSHRSQEVTDNLVRKTYTAIAEKVP